MTDRSAELLAALRVGFGRRWEISVAGDRLRIAHPAAGSPYHPPRRIPDFDELLDRLRAGFLEVGVPSAAPLPVRGQYETDFTISAVQALNPYLTRRLPYADREGYVAQPVVRFTGDRDGAGKLREGFLTSFVNVSQIGRTASVGAHVEVLDGWLTVLSRLGLNARQIEIGGSLVPWSRGDICGITLRYRHAGLALGDIVLLWNAQAPDRLATDLGSGLERLRWVISRRPWPEVVFGPHQAEYEHLDALRTAVLIVGSGIRPAARGPGSAVRRLLALVPAATAAYGLSGAVRRSTRFWSLVTPMTVPWPDITSRLERELR